MPSSPTAPPRTIPDTPLPDARLADHLSRVPDPRQARGKRYPVPGVLLVAVSAAMAGCRGFTATGEWAARLTDKNLNEFALRSAPGESTLRKLVARITAALDGHLCLYAWTRTTLAGAPRDRRRRENATGLPLGGRAGPPPGRRPRPHVGDGDGPTGGRGQVHRDTGAAAVIKALGERAAGAVITADALHTQTASATAILAAGVDYVFTVKSNQSTLHKNLAGQP
ncbi:transposase family protein [Cutibacterium avidum]|uniref:transposase family protein n=1 Tax=Cutibacterium avidum TaxID=33010 RepID=UPI0025B44D70|nr:transposase family protein [Cutibacterium avidum]MCO6676074.1 transposase family protein [Cutibacterium avidum]